MCELKKLTLNGSPSIPLLPVPGLLFEEEVLSANRWGCAFWKWPCKDGGGL